MAEPHEPEPDPNTTLIFTSHHTNPPPPPHGLTNSDLTELIQPITEFHTHKIKPGRQCSSLFAQKINAPPSIVWSILRQFDNPQAYKLFVKSCTLCNRFPSVGSIRDICVTSGLPAERSTERLEVLDDQRHVIGFSIIGGNHRLSNYHSVTTVHSLPVAHDEGEWTIVLESYVVDVPQGNTVDETITFCDTIVMLNLQKLGSVAAKLAREPACDGGGGCDGVSLLDGYSN